MYKFGDVILAQIQFVETFDIKTRPALVLFQEYGNIVVVGITSNINMDGIKLTKKDGCEKDSVIKLNYIFTISELMIKKELFSISNPKKQEIKEEIIKRLI